MLSVRSRCLRACLALALVLSTASLLLGLGGGSVAVLDLAPFLLLLCLTLVLPDASARLVEAVVEAGPRPRRRAHRAGAPRPLRAERDGGRIPVASRGARAPPLGIRPAFA
jgi:hypothetical protein